MQKSYIELQYLEEKKIKEYLKKLDGVKDDYRLTLIYNTLAIICFIINLLVIIAAGVCEYLIIDINSLIINILIVSLALISLGLQIVSLFYKNKTIDILNGKYKE